ncbi:MAG: protein-methionine-sulfoxide reductase heme-binding subunit MsrQ [Colwellia sp.]|nr:protein-methionine-sulfoxide reductase heme-binding subunit MsrQ [Colwellia sp.]MCW8864918.1 protein-methionine-sulfoxide reductase heme-binding subunit MsrQ [Colwellia sp.]MCW9080536.1 protein-methionine-sulfoxide reductase heme-binding subunit MsrQ [Colwellia sp.]
MNKSNKVFFLKVFIHFAAILPLYNLYFLAFADGLGADPVEAVIHFTGIGSLNLLLITLCVSPLAKMLKQGELLKTRRLLGLYAFTYAMLHLFNFLAFEVQFDGALFIGEIIERPYITVGMVAFILLSALAITSVHALKRRMGKSWQRLHNVSYLLILLVTIHFYWSVKSDLSAPLFYFFLCFVLLFFRYQKLKRLFFSLFTRSSFR